MPSVAPIIAEPVAVRESRLVLRVLSVWRYARREDELPRADALGAEDMGEEWIMFS